MVAIMSHKMEYTSKRNDSTKPRFRRRVPVDADCRVHEIPNLYVAGSSVFPTGGHANPTLSIVMLSARLGARLADQRTAAPSRLVAGGVTASSAAEPAPPVDQ